MSMILTEYDEELYNETLREEGQRMEWQMQKLYLNPILSGKSDEEISKVTGISL